MAAYPAFEQVQGRIADFMVVQEGLRGALPWFEQIASGDAPDKFKKAHLETLLKITNQRADSGPSLQLARQYSDRPWLPAPRKHTRPRQNKYLSLPPACYRFILAQMKIIFFSLGFLLIGQLATSMALEIPRSTNRIGDLKKVTEKATKGKKGILWVYTDPALKPT